MSEAVPLLLSTLGCWVCKLFSEVSSDSVWALPFPTDFGCSKCMKKEMRSLHNVNIWIKALGPTIIDSSHRSGYFSHTSPASSQQFSRPRHCANAVAIPVGPNTPMNGNIPVAQYAHTSQWVLKRWLKK